MAMKFGGRKRFTLGWWIALPFSLGEIWKRMTPKDPMVHGQCYWWFGDLPRRHPQDVFENSAQANFTIRNAGRRDPTTSTTLYEISCILMGLKEAGAKKVIEIGTFDGNTTLNLAANVPADGKVYTVDLPPEEGAQASLDIDDSLRNVTDRNRVGEQYLESDERQKIEQVFGDSAKIDFKALVEDELFDFAFIDGCHAYEYVKKDTENIASIVKPGGIVMWHDYAEMDDVSRAVDEYRDRFEGLCAIQGTRLAVARVRAN